jgi:predicted DNA-binding protein (MmcQ/YjbR family)
VTVKCGAGREEADEWLARHPDDASVASYIGRSGWNRLLLGAGIPDDELVEAVDDSYARVVSRLPRKHRPDGWDG